MEKRKVSKIIKENSEKIWKGAIIIGGVLVGIVVAIMLTAKNEDDLDELTDPQVETAEIEFNLE